jgi:hypothetical protein
MRCKTRCADDALAAARDEIDRQMPSAPITNQESRQLDGSIRRERERELAFLLTFAPPAWSNLGVFVLTGPGTNRLVPCWDALAWLALFSFVDRVRGVNSRACS